MAVCWSAGDDMLPPADSTATYQGMAERGNAMRAITTTGGHLDAASRLVLSSFRYFESVGQR